MDEKPKNERLPLPRAFWILLVIFIATYALTLILIFTHPRGVALEFHTYPVKTTLAISAVMFGIVTGTTAGAIYVTMRRRRGSR